MTAGSRPDPAITQIHGWRLGQVGGIPVYLGRSWPIIAVVIVVTFGPQVRQPTGQSGGAFGVAVAVAYAVLLLISVLAHEGAHALVARRFGYQVDRVVADLWGGHTVYDSSTSRPGASAGIAVAGPAANLAVAALGYAAQGLAPDGVVGLLLGAVTLANLFVGAFNLLPGLPLDGGFLVDALVWRLTGDRNRGLIVAGWLGRILTVAVVLWLVARPLLLGQQPSLFTIIWCGLIGAFLWAGATNAIRSGTSRRVVAKVPLGRVLRPVVVVGAHESLAAAMARMDGAGGGGPEPVAVVVSAGGEPLGVLQTEVARQVEPGRWQQVPVEAVLSRQPDGWVVVVPSRDVDVTGVVTAIVARQASTPPTMLVVTVAGELLGTVSVADLNAAFSA